MKFNKELGVSKYVLANMSYLSPKAQEFIALHTSEANCVAGGSTYFVYTHAQQITLYPIVYDLCATQFLLDNPKYLLSPDVTSYDNIHYQTQVQVPDNTTTVTNSYGNTIDAGHRVGITPPSYKKMSEDINALFNALRGATTIDKLSPILDNIGKYQCVINSIDITTRLELLDVIIASGNDAYILIWIRNTPASQRKEVVDHFINTRGALTSAWNNLSGNDLDEFVNLITNWFLTETNIDRDTYKNIPPPPTISADNSTNYFILKDFGITNKYSFGNGIVLSNQILSILQSDVSITDNITVYSSKPTEVVSRKFSGSPFDLVVLEAGIGFENYSDDFKTGNRILVPAIYAHWMIHRYNLDKSFKQVSIAVEAISLIATLGESSVVIAAIEAAISTTNIVLTINQKALAQDSDCAAFMDVWNLFDVAYSGVSTLKMIGSSKQFSFVYQNIQDKYKTLSSTDKQTFVSKLNGLAIKLSNLSSLTASATQNIILGSKKVIELASSMSIENVAFIANTNYKTLTKYVGDEIKACVISSGIYYQVATTELKTDGSLLLTDINWASGNNSSLTKVGTYSNIKYVDNSGKQSVGNLEIVQASDKTIYLRSLEIADNGGGSLLDNIYNVQKSIVGKWIPYISTATNIQKGNFGEMASDALLTEKGFQPLHTRLDNIDQPTKQGLDGVFKKGSEYFIVEAKYRGTATLNTLTDGTKQMSDAWISQNDYNRLLNAVGDELTREIRNKGYRRLLAESAPDGTVVYKELDSSANVIQTFNP